MVEAAVVAEAAEVVAAEAVVVVAVVEVVVEAAEVVVEAEAAAEDRRHHNRCCGSCRRHGNARPAGPCGVEVRPRCRGDGDEEVQELRARGPGNTENGPGPQLRPWPAIVGSSGRRTVVEPGTYVKPAGSSSLIS